MIPYIVYSLCTITSALCAAALLLQYRRRRVRLLFWSAICFLGFALNNLLLDVDYSLGPHVDLSVIRTIPAVAGIALMVWAFIWEAI